MVNVLINLGVLANLVLLWWLILRHRGVCLRILGLFQQVDHSFVELCVLVLFMSMAATTVMAFLTIPFGLTDPLAHHRALIPENPRVMDWVGRVAGLVFALVTVNYVGMRIFRYKLKLEYSRRRRNEGRSENEEHSN